ncbi:MAG: glycosyltransferase family 2 protein [Deltaproteobacteria bacterium]|jgi:glycosyltransferase involved in cell wall biosynthesis|nr:glycosyltransferase family 2 protein [Deltaproteobacteria bacterium]
MNNNLTVVVPAFNDAAGLEVWLPRLLTVAQRHGWRVIVVDDGSTDDTPSVLQAFGDRIQIIRHEVNSGYGAALKSGMLAAGTPWVASMDADGQHRLEDLEAMAGCLDSSVDALIGARTRESHTPLARRPGKWILRQVANILSGVKIPDINCGLRIFRRDIIIQFFSVTSDRFSFSTSCLVALSQCRCRIRYIPVTIERRIGKSAVKQARDGLYTCALILRLIFLFKPARILLPIGFGVFLCAACLLFVHIVFIRMSTMTVIAWVSGLFILLISLLADQVSGIRRDFFMRAIRETHERNQDEAQTAKQE